MLVDDVTVRVKAGDGGSGAMSFRRNAQTRKGGPDGGNGGKGGDIYIKGIDDLDSLRLFRYKKEIIAQSGVSGKKNNLFGKNAEDLTINVPFGTDVIDGESMHEVKDGTSVILIAKGGQGGRGNNFFKSATNQTPRYAEKGEKGEEKTVRFVLRIIGDVGLIGLPNSGKSSILKTITNATPKIGDYPFTTLEPNLGVMEKVVIADIPGIIEDASKGKGLGIGFLKHIEKTKLLIQCIDIQEDVLTSYKKVQKELAEFDPKLTGKVKLILLTKKDLASDEVIKSKSKTLENMNLTVIPFSIYDQSDTDFLKKFIKKHT